MLDVVSFENRTQYLAELEAMYELRHRIFVERMGWEALRDPQGRERDQFDTLDALYLIAKSDSAIIGCHRLLATTGPHLFSDVFAHLCNREGVQRGASVFEINRTCVDQDRLDRSEVLRTQKMIMVGLIEFCVRAGIERLTVLGPLKILSHYLQLGWSIKPLGEPVEIDGEAQAAFSVWTDGRCLELIRAAYALNGSFVRYVGGTSNLKDLCAILAHRRILAAVG